jgi:undecaprenyl-diphosphatase
LGLLVAALLGVLQGLTEFLPVSSSGHLRLLAAWFGLEEPQTLFDVVLHIGTLVPVVIVYRDELGRMIAAAWRVVRGRATPRTDADARLVVLVVVATIPTGLLGLGLGGFFEALSADIGWVALALAGNAGILLALGALTRRAERRPGRGRGLAELTLRDALVVGVVQGLAVFRGISRSGSTITAGMACGLDREAAAAFSFLLAIPAICGALVLTFDLDALSGEAWAPVLVGGVVAAASGLVALRFLLRLLRRGRLHHFAWYCLAIAAIAGYWRLS